MQAVLAHSALTFAQKAILIRLALHLNLKSGRCDPSIETIAVGVGVEDRAVQTAITKAQALGWLTRHEGGGRGNTNSYSPRLREGHAPAETPHGSAPFEETPHERLEGLLPMHDRATTASLAHLGSFKSRSPAPRRDAGGLRHRRKLLDILLSEEKP
jgi:hypothetical protein